MNSDTFYFDNHTYVLIVNSDEKDDWNIRVFESRNMLEVIHRIDHHNMMDLPASIRASVILSIDRIRSNIAVDNVKKRSWN